MAYPNVRGTGVQAPRRSQAPLDTLDAPEYVKNLSVVHYRLDVTTARAISAAKKHARQENVIVVVVK